MQRVPGRLSQWGPGRGSCLARDPRRDGNARELHVAVCERCRVELSGWRHHQRRLLNTKWGHCLRPPTEYSNDRRPSGHPLRPMPTPRDDACRTPPPLAADARASADANFKGNVFKMRSDDFSTNKDHLVTFIPNLSVVSDERR